MKIVFFGDSLTEGTWGVSYVDKAAALLPGHHFLNRGVNGDTSLNLYRRVSQDVIAEKPDGVFMMVGVNDAVSAVAPITRPYYRFVKRVPRGTVSPISFRENLRAILGRLRRQESKPGWGWNPLNTIPNRSPCCAR
jgi:lysophospholipase L1-like esterase